ncbi:type IV secretory system conjugative DNA transfer family protein [Brevundimonas sp.]|uniref:type IV secretory system conjugative DNA transfer family protein n=1 Tax=Brevundimonas sp. TaxID=1871086 RepID=UPI003D6D8E5A
MSALRPSLAPNRTTDADIDLLVAVLGRSLSSPAGRAMVARLVDAFGGLAGVAAADEAALRREGLSETGIAVLSRVQKLGVAMARAEACRRPVLSSWTALTSYLRVALAHAPREQFRALYLDRRNILIREELRADGPHNTILDNCHVYTAFSALDPLTQDKVSKLTGSVMETRTSRSAPSGLGAGRGSVSRAEVERPLLEPGEIRALPDDRQLVFVSGRRPLRTEKLLYDRREPFRSRAGEAPPDQAARVDAPERPPHPWFGRRSLGRDAMASLPLFKEVAGAMDDRKAAARAADIYGRVAQEMAAQQAVLDQLQGGSDG